jgi:hypothetical protein
MDQKIAGRILALGILALAIAAFVPSSVEAVRCYSCNSGGLYDGETCKHGSVAEKHLVDCEQQSSREQLNRTYTMCRIFEQDVEGDYRVVRSCATDGQPDKGCVQRTGTRGIKLSYCECLGDGCNSADRLASAPVRLALVTSLVLAAARLAPTVVDIL